MGSPEERPRLLRQPGWTAAVPGHRFGQEDPPQGTTPAAGYDYAIVDGPPRVNEVARAAIAASDLVIIPVQPSPYDVWAAKEIVDLLAEAAAFREVRSAFVINRRNR